jgi:hypothetical protein
MSSDVFHNFNYRWTRRRGHSYVARRTSHGNSHTTTTQNVSGIILGLCWVTSHPSYVLVEGCYDTCRKSLWFTRLHRHDYSRRHTGSSISTYVAFQRYSPLLWRCDDSPTKTVRIKTPQHFEHGFLHNKFPPRPCLFVVPDEE